MDSFGRHTCEVQCQIVLDSQSLHYLCSYDSPEVSTDQRLCRLPNICNRSHAKRADSGKITIFRGASLVREKSPHPVARNLLTRL